MPVVAELCRRGEHEIVLVTADDNHESLDDFRTCRRVLFAHGSLAGLRRRARRLPRPLRTAVEAGVRLAARGLAPVAGTVAARLAPALRGGSTFTDDRAPVEWLTDLSLLGYAAGKR